MDKLYVVILAGGYGLRLWPLTSRLLPKQHLPFRDNKTLLQLTCERMERLFPSAELVIMTTRDLEDQTRQHISCHPQIQAKVSYIIEPAVRNTGPAFYWAARAIAQHNPHAVMLMVPSDHFICDEAAFGRALNEAVHGAMHDTLALLGALPTFPSCEYGYIKRKSDVSSFGGYAVDSFHEKPVLKDALNYLVDPLMLWNMGVVAARAGRICSEFEQYEPSIPQQIMRYESSAYDIITPISFDKAVLEKTKEAVVVPVECGWNDVGSLEKFLTLAHNVLPGATLVRDDHMNTIIYAYQQVQIKGMHDLYVVQTPEGIMIMPREDKDMQQPLRKTPHKELSISSL